MTLQIGKNLRVLAIFLLAALWAGTASAALTVSVDRTEISDADLIKLTIRVDNTTASNNPDFSILEQNFDIVQRAGPNQSSRISIINGRQTSEVSVSWELRLRAKRLGELTIPAFKLGNDISKPINIRVRRQSEEMKRKMSQLVFFDTSVDTTETYVQGQILYTIKLYYVENISGDYPPMPNIPDAVIEIVEDEKRYDSITNGRRYYVLEKRYGVYPQKSGTLTIPAQTFSGYRVGPGFFSTREPVLSRSESHTIDVKPKPASFSGAHWLPAASVTAEAKWLGGKPNFTVGEPINRTIEINAIGVASSLLPQLSAPIVSGAKTYQDPPVEEQKLTKEGITSKQTIVVGIVPTQAGTLVLPEVSIPWWNTRTNRMEVAVISAETHFVAPSPQSKVTASEVSSTPISEQQTEVSGSQSQPDPFWQYLAYAFILLWLLTLTLWFVSRRQNVQLNGPANVVTPKIDSLKALKSACHQGDGAGAQRHLISWGTEKYGRIDSLQELSNKLNDDDITLAIKDLEQRLYSKSATGQWDGANLITAVTRLDRGLQSNRPHQESYDASSKKRASRLSDTLNPN